MDMLTHSQIWAAIDELAKRSELSASGLARNAGLDSTSFNPSKRFTAEGRERWPSTESIAKILRATGTSVSDFLEILDPDAKARLARLSKAMPAGDYKQTASSNSVRSSVLRKPVWEVSLMMAGFQLARDGMKFYHLPEPVNLLMH